MRPTFKENKATELAGYFLVKSGGEMSSLRLLKLLYCTDRAAFLRWGFFVTCDHYVSMEFGPVCSSVYDLIKGEHRTGHWEQYISPRKKTYEVELLQSVPAVYLSEAETELADEIWETHHAKDPFELSNYTHKEFPEWTDPGKGAKEIDVEVILESEGIPEAERREILEELDSWAREEALLGT